MCNTHIFRGYIDDSYSLILLLFSVTSCDFESLCHWTLSSHGAQSDWSVVSPQQPEIPEAGMMPETDHSVGSSDGKSAQEVNERIQLKEYVRIPLMRFSSVNHPVTDLWTYAKLF